MGIPFNSPIKDDGKIIGFKGRCRGHIDSIEAYLAPTKHAYPFEIIGPFGSEMGETSDDGKNTSVRQIYIIAACDGIEAITIVYDKYGQAGDFITHDMKANEESIITIQCLTFQSNIKMYGPYGTEEGKFFSFPSIGGKIVGLFGSCNAYLESTGAYFEPVSHHFHYKTFGPFGGEGGHEWDDGQHDGVSQIIISCGVVVNSVSFQYGNAQSSKHGGSGGRTHMITLDWPNEYLTLIFGYFGEFEGCTVIRKLMLHSIRRTYGPYGTNWGTPSEFRYFTLPSNVGKIVGFKGTCCLFLDSIGAYVKPHCKEIYPFKSVGLFGGNGGKSWDNGRYTDVRQITIILSNDDSVITSIQFEYERDVALIQCPLHGANHNGKRH